MRHVIPFMAWLVAGAWMAPAQTSGQAEFAVQGYYLRTGSQLTAGSTGVALKFEEFLPNIGLVRGNFEAYRSQGGLQPADNYLQLHGLVWQGLRWNLDAGDFRASGSLIRNPFTNLFFPEINARGVQVEAGSGSRSYTFFYGNETLLAGPRIPFRVGVPQKAMGVAVRQTFGKLETGVRLMRLDNTSRDASQNFTFPAGRDFRSADNLTFYSSYTLSEHLRWYGEATAARSQSADGTPGAQPFSYFFGPAWESPRLTVKVNYAELSRSYFPLAGYWIGDRKGPFGEFRIRPLRSVEFYGSANRYETASKPQEKLPMMRSVGTSAGVSVELPWKWNVSAQVSTTDFKSSDPVSNSVQHAYNRQLTGTLSRRFGPHTVRLTERDMQLVSNGAASRERAIEAEDTLQIHHILLGGSARAQQSAASERRNTIYVRGSAQVNLGRLTAFAFIEGGKDLANKTVFATVNTNSTVISANLRVTRRWSVQGEAFRSRLISQINPESLFVQGSQNLSLNPVLNQFNQWSFLFRVTRTFHWGAPMPPMGLDQFTVRRIPITGTVEGLVWVLTGGGRQPAAGVVIALESGRSVKTDANGRYRFPEVAEGPHVVSIDMEQLPADYNPGPNVKIPVAIGARKAVRADFDLYSLASFAGKVTAAPGSSFQTLEGILVRLEPGGRYTTTTSDGSFAFYNVPEGAYEVKIAAETLPGEARLKGDGAARVTIQTGIAPPMVQFEVERQQAGEKPVRSIINKVLGQAPAESHDKQK